MKLKSPIARLGRVRRAARPSAPTRAIIEALPVLLICAILLATMWDRMINIDVAWYLIAVREWLGGAGLYSHIVEVNPPLNFYYTLPSLWLADALSISAQNGQYIFTTGLILTVLIWCQSILRNQFQFTGARFYLATLLLAVGLILPAVFHFGQREQTFVLLLMPWLLGQCAERPASRRQEIIRAIVGGLGLCLKPHFVLIPIAITLLYMAQRRSLRPIISAANMSFLAVGLAYVAFVAVQHPAYFTMVVPTARDVYGALQPDLLLLVFRAIGALALGSLIGVGLLAFKPTGKASPVLLTAALAAFVVYWVQGMGFPYHLLPLNSFLLIAAGLGLLQIRPQSVTFWVIAITALWLCQMQVARGFFKNQLAGEVVEIVKSDASIQSYMAISSYITVGPGVALEAGVDWISLYPSNWLVPGAVNRLQASDCAVEVILCARLNSHLDRNRSANIADIQRRPPDLILIDRYVWPRHRGYFDRPGFSWLDFMAQDPAWPEIIAQYETYRVTDTGLYMRRRSRQDEG